MAEVSLLQEQCNDLGSVGHIVDLCSLRHLRGSFLQRKTLRFILLIYVALRDIFQLLHPANAKALSRGRHYSYAGRL